MKIVKKIRFSRNEAKEIKTELGNYIWVAIDTRKGIISAGDEYIADLRDALLQKRSRTEDILGIGVNLATGEIDYHASINRRNPLISALGNIPMEQQLRVETLVNYFFEAFEPFKRDRAAASRRRPCQPLALSGV